MSTLQQRISFLGGSLINKEKMVTRRKAQTQDGTLNTHKEKASAGRKSDTMKVRKSLKSRKPSLNHSKGRKNANADSLKMKQKSPARSKLPENLPVTDEKIQESEEEWDESDLFSTGSFNYFEVHRKHVIDRIMKLHDFEGYPDFKQEYHVEHASEPFPWPTDISFYPKDVESPPGPSDYGFKEEGKLIKKEDGT